MAESESVTRESESESSKNGLMSGLEFEYYSCPSLLGVESRDVWCPSQNKLNFSKFLHLVHFSGVNHTFEFGFC